MVGFGLRSRQRVGLQLLSDRGMMTTRLGTASLGVLLFKDLAVIAFIVALPCSRDAVGEGGRGPARRGAHGRVHRRASWTSAC